MKVVLKFICAYQLIYSCIAGIYVSAPHEKRRKGTFFFAHTQALSQ